MCRCASESSRRGFLPWRRRAIPPGRHRGDMARMLSGTIRIYVKIHRNKLPLKCSDRLSCMRGQDNQQSDMFSYLSPEQRVRPDHPLRAIRAMADLALWSMSSRFDEMYSQTGRPSIPPEKLLRAQLLQMLYSIRSERLLMEEIHYSVLFRWFVGMNM